MIWGCLKWKLNWSEIHGRPEAIERIRATWDQLSQDIIDALCRSFPRSVEMVGEPRGHTIQPLVNSHRTTVPEGYLADARTVVYRAWTPGKTIIFQRSLK
jgi:hypothetical protein